MILSRLRIRVRRSLMSALAASAVLVPLAAQAMRSNHDVQRVVLHRCTVPHDRAEGPGSA